MEDIKLKPRGTDKQQYGTYLPEHDLAKSGAKYMGIEHDLTLGGGHTMPHPDHVP